MVILASLEFHPLLYHIGFAHWNGSYFLEDLADSWAVQVKLSILLLKHFVTLTIIEIVLVLGDKDSVFVIVFLIVWVKGQRKNRTLAFPDVLNTHCIWLRSVLMFHVEKLPIIRVSFKIF